MRFQFNEFMKKKENMKNIRQKPKRKMIHTLSYVIPHYLYPNKM